LYVVGIEFEKRDGYRRLPVPNGRYDNFVPWLRSIAGRFDAAIAPLTDTPFNRAKSALKFMELAACGLPTVASRVSPYLSTIREEEDGLLADDVESWITQLKRLLHDPALRQRLGSAARRRAENEFACAHCVFDGLEWRERSVRGEVRQVRD
jgi:glycosyltransferase involved in cell wall biosynthesis